MRTRRARGLCVARVCAVGAWLCGTDCCAAHASCSLSDLLFETRYAAQVFDWQNAVFLLFMPLMLALATFTFKALFGSSGNVRLHDIFKNAGDMHEVYKDWNTRGSQHDLIVAGANMGTDDAGAATETEQAAVTRDEAREGADRPGDLEMTQLTASLDITGGSCGVGGGGGGGAAADPTSSTEEETVVVITSSHPTDVDPRNVAVMISVSSLIISLGFVCWSALSDFVVTY